ncbi:hypothetical protein ACO0RG_003741 [Hanseniaspora osmophila]
MIKNIGHLQAAIRLDSSFAGPQAYKRLHTATQPFLQKAFLKNSYPKLNFHSAKLAPFSFQTHSLYAVQHHQQACRLSTIRKISQQAYSQANSKNPKQSAWQKVKNATTFTASGVLVLGAAGLAIVVVYLIFSELFLPSGDTHIFNRAVNLIEDDAISRNLLECNDTNVSKPDGTHHITKEKLKAYGETIKDDHWTRNRPIQSMRKVGVDGKERYFMRFHVESEKKLGTVYVEAKESETKFQPEFIVIYIDVPGKRRHYLVKPQISRTLNNTKGKGFLGLNWGPKK